MIVLLDRKVTPEQIDAAIVGKEHVRLIIIKDVCLFNDNDGIVLSSQDA